MEASTNISPYSDQKPLKYFSMLILITLLLLRIVLFGWFPILVEGNYPWIEPVYQIGTYALTALFILLNKDQLSLFNIDKLAIWIIILFKPLQTLIMPIMGENFSSNQMSFPNLPALLIWVIAAFLLALLLPRLKTMPKIQKDSWGWLLIGAVTGVLLVLVLSFILLPWSAIRKVTPIYDITLLLAFPYQIAYAGIDEEPLFRGLLWGWLRRLGWKVNYVIFIQAFVFMLAHGRLLTSMSNLPFALSILLGGVVFGFLVLRSRSISSSILAHGFYNASNTLCYYLISNLFAS